MSRYAIEHHSSSDDSWSTFSDSMWRPRKTPMEAIAKAMAWTGFLYIPDMQVRDLASGEVIWRRCDNRGGHVQTMVEIPHPDEELAETIAQSLLDPAARAERPPAPSDHDPSQGALF